MKPEDTVEAEFRAMTNQEILENCLQSANRKVEHFQTQITCFKNKTQSFGNLKELEASLACAKRDCDRIGKLLIKK